MGRVGKLVKAIAAFFEDKQEKKIIGVQIGDKKIKTRNATNAYCVVHKFLYAMDQQAYTSLGAVWFSGEWLKYVDEQRENDLAAIIKDEKLKDKETHIFIENLKILNSLHACSELRRIENVRYEINGYRG